MGLLLAPIALAACAEPADTFIEPSYVACDASADTPAELKVVTYNIKAGLESSLDEIGDVLFELDPDVVLLQEVDNNVDRTGNVDQAGALAERLGMDYAYGAAKVQRDGDFGLAVLSRLPFAGAERIELPSEGSFEPRIALAGDVCVGGRSVRVFSTHSDLNPMAQEAQQRALAEHAAPYVETGVIVGGDMNATFEAPGLQALFNTPLVDTAASHTDKATCAGRTIDFVLADGALGQGSVDADVIETDASDHYPVVVEIAL